MKKRIFSRLTLGLIIIFTLALTQCLPLEDTEVKLTQVPDFGTNPGNLAMYKFVPEGISGDAPLVVALHGCTQNAETYAKDSGWTDLAAEYQFYVLLPQQTSANNSNKCFNWFEPGDTARDSGEALSIIQMVDKMKNDYGIDAKKIFVTGLSAGGYFTSVMAATYPDVFAGAAVMAGGPYKCAAGMVDAFTCMSSIPSKTGAVWGGYVTDAFPGYTGSYPKMSLWMGTSDKTVKPANQTESVKQWAYVLHMDANADITESIQGNTHKIYQNSDGETLMEAWDITDMGHAITVDPDGTNGKPGGVVDSYSNDFNVWSSYEVAKLWGLDNADRTAPTVAITAPSNGEIVSGSVAVSASASDNKEVVKVEIYIDQVLAAAFDAAPYNHIWNAAQASNGSHVILVKAYDGAGNSGTASAGVTVTGGVEDATPPVISADPSEGTYVSNVTVKLSSNETATIYYTIDNSTPTQGSSVYLAPLNFSATTTLKFFGRDSAGNASEVTPITYTIKSVPYSEAVSATLTEHYRNHRITTAEYIDLGIGTNTSGINPGKVKYGYISEVVLYKLADTNDWVTEQTI